MLSPKRVKYRKQMKGRMRGNATRGTQISFGEYGLQSLDRGWISNRSIEAARAASYAAASTDCLAISTRPPRMIIATNSPKAGTPIAASMATDPRSSWLRLKARARMLCPLIR